MLRKMFRNKKHRGQGLVEYIIIVASVAMIALVAVSIFGHKVTDQYAIAAGMLPGAHGHDNLPIRTGWFADVDDDGTSQFATGGVSWNPITGRNDGIPGPGGGSNNVWGSNLVVGGSTFVVD